jgi:hypothetical protein
MPSNDSTHGTFPPSSQWDTLRKPHTCLHCLWMHAPKVQPCTLTCLHANSVQLLSHTILFPHLLVPHLNLPTPIPPLPSMLPNPLSFNRCTHHFWMPTHSPLCYISGHIRPFHFALYLSCLCHKSKADCPCTSIHTLLHPAFLTFAICPTINKRTLRFETASLTQHPLTSFIHPKVPIVNVPS